MASDRAGTPGGERRRIAERRGRRAEAVAALWLRLKGYRVVDRRVRTPVGEIDLVLRRGRLVVFAEVKRRGAIADGLTAVGPAQRRRIGRAAQWWLARHPALADRTIRFDLLVIPARGWPRHLANAWMEGL